MSLHHALYGQPFNAEHLLPFGTLVVAHKEVTGKLDPKGRPGIYVGESADHAKGTVKIFMPTPSVSRLATLRRGGTATGLKNH